MMKTLEGAATLEELAVLVRSHLGAACALVTRITQDRQHVLALAGRRMPDWFMHSAPLDYSICCHSVAMDFPLVIEDTLLHPLMRNNLAVHELGITAYLGAPVHAATGESIGTVCALEFHRRRWTEEDVSFIIKAARIADRIFVKGERPR